jgi:hypothetical protein
MQTTTLPQGAHVELLCAADSGNAGALRAIDDLTQLVKRTPVCELVPLQVRAVAASTECEHSLD